MFFISLIVTCLLAYFSNIYVIYSYKHCIWNADGDTYSICTGNRPLYMPYLDCDVSTNIFPDEDMIKTSEERNMSSWLLDIAFDEIRTVKFKQYIWNFINRQFCDRNLNMNNYRFHHKQWHILEYSCHPCWWF